MRFTDLTADPHEREWGVDLADGGGLRVRALDAEGAVFDELTLKRYGAFIVMEWTKDSDAIPEALEFLRPAIEYAARRRLLGMTGDLPPFLVRSTAVRKLWEFGHINLGFGPFRERGRAMIMDVPIVWDSRLDDTPGLL